MENIIYNNLMDFGIICRICLEKKSKLNPLFDASVAKMVMECASVIVLEGDGLPDKICTQCTLLVSRAHRFKQLCEKSENTLRQYIDNSRLACMKSELLLADHTLEHGSVFSDIFMKTDTCIADPLVLEPTTFSTDVTALEASMAECLPSLWNMKRSDDFCSDPLSDAFCDNTLQTLNLNKDNRVDSWNPENELHDLDSSTYSKSYIDLDHSSRLIHEFRSRKENQTTNCEICGTSYSDVKLLKKHLTDIHPQENLVDDKRHMCSICGKRYKENKLLKLHMRSHTGERPLKCEICQKDFALPSSLHAHRKLHTEGRMHHCTLCNKSFRQASNLVIHMRTHTGDKRFACNLCGKKFGTKQVLDYHSKIHTGDKPFGCMHCEMAFRSKTELNKHAKKHTGLKNYQCKYCGQTFRHKESRDSHQRTHTGERPYNCVACAKSYTARSHLRAHILTHTGERRHQCNVCNKYFMQRRHVRQHMRSHSGERPFSCMICGRNFKHSGSLSTHMKTHAALKTLVDNLL